MVCEFCRKTAKIGGLGGNGFVNAYAISTYKGYCLNY